MELRQFLAGGYTDIPRSRRRTGEAGACVLRNPARRRGWGRRPLTLGRARRDEDGAERSAPAPRESGERSGYEPRLFIQKTPTATTITAAPMIIYIIVLSVASAAFGATSSPRARIPRAAPA